MTVEPICDLTSFVNNPVVSTTLERNYQINSGLEEFPFEIKFVPSCNYIKSYSVSINGAVNWPTWITIDQSSEPHKVQIQSTNASHDGVYSVAI